jgi:hypothetical protein
MIIEENKDSTVSELINNIKSLRHNNMNEALRMEKYIENIYYLLKANELILFENKVNTWVPILNILKQKETSDELKTTAFELISKAKERGFAYEQIRYSYNNIENPIAIAFSLETDNDKSLSIFFTITYINQDALNNTILKTQLINDVLKNNSINTNQILQNNTIANKDIQYILNLSSGLLEIKKFKILANTFVNDISVNFGLEKVSLGMFENDKLKLISISHIDEFSKTHIENESLLELFDESASQDEDIILLSLEDSNLVNISHKKYFIDHNIKTLITFPIRFKEKIIGVISGYSLEKVYSENEVLLLRLTVNKIAPIINNLYESDISLQSYLFKRVKDWTKYWLSPKASFLKIIVLLSSLSIFYIMLFTWKYEVDATSILITDKESYVTSPFVGIIDEVYVQAGDQVSTNQNLFSLNVDELIIKEMESRADIIRYEKENSKFIKN